MLYNGSKRNQSQKPSSDDKKMFDYVLKHTGAGEKATYVALANFALLWKDLESFKRVVTANAEDINLDVLTKDKLIKAYSTFSFTDMQIMCACFNSIYFGHAYEYSTLGWRRF
jgi:hypothetical protein